MLALLLWKQSKTGKEYFLPKEIFPLPKRIRGGDPKNTKITLF